MTLCICVSPGRDYMHYKVMRAYTLCMYVYIIIIMDSKKILSTHYCKQWLIEMCNFFNYYRFVDVHVNIH